LLQQLPQLVASSRQERLQLVVWLLLEQLQLEVLSRQEQPRLAVLQPVVLLLVEWNLQLSGHSRCYPLLENQ
jgi:hypothetical protein